MESSSDWKMLPFPEAQGFLGANGPFLARAGREGVLNIGMEVTQRHCNAAGNCHGGMLATFADLQLTFGARYALKVDSFLTTISLSSDFLAGAQLGSWLEGETRVLKTTRNLVFCECLVRADSEPVLRANAILRNARPGEPLHPIRLQEMFGGKV